MIRYLIGPVVICSLVWGCGDDDDDDDEVPTPDAAMQGDAGPPADAASQRDADIDAMGASVEAVNCNSVAADQIVDMENISYDPAQLTIAAGEVVQWTNLDVEQHTVTSGRPGQAGAGDLFDSGLLDLNEDYCLRFNELGSYEYYCTVHPDIMDDGVVTVQ